MTSGSSLRNGQLRLVAATLLLCAGIAACWKTAAPAGVDFPSLYVMGRGIVEGSNIYAPAVATTFPAKYNVMVPAGMFYPPATGFTMLPFAVLPFHLARLVWLFVLELVAVLGVRSLVRRLAPSAGPEVWVACAGVVMLSSALRWAMLLLQGAPLVLGLLCWFLSALHGGRPRLAALIAAIAVAVKMTLSVPFVGLLILQRRFVAAFAGVATWASLNALGFLRMGADALPDYRASVGKLEAFGDINSPDPWNVVSSPRLDWTSLLYGTTGNLPFARLGTLALTGLVCLWLLREGLRERAPRSLEATALFLPPLVILGCLCVYHHHYDSCLYFAPVLALYLVFGWQRLRNWGFFLLLPPLLLMLVLPFGKAQDLVNSVFGLRGVGLLKLSFPIAFSGALVGSLLLLSRGEWRGSLARDTASPKR